MPWLCWLLACVDTVPDEGFPVRDPVEDHSDPPRGNVLLVLADDIGMEVTGAYESQDVFPTYTPNIDALADEGVLFRNAFVTPSCSPTRATLLTGRYPTRHGIGRWIKLRSEAWDLQLDELTLPEMLSMAGYTSAAFGKWHLVAGERDHASLHPLDQGFVTHRGTLANNRESLNQGEFTRGYFMYEENVDGALSWETEYLTTRTVDDALEAMETLPEPWFVYLALNAAHEPWDVPPGGLNLPDVTSTSPPEDRFDAVISAADSEIGRLLDSMSPEHRAETTIIYLADNGTPPPVARPPYSGDRVKKSVFDGGIRVPMIITGPLVDHPGTEVEAMVEVVDLFPTLARIAGVDVDVLTGQEGDSWGRDLHLDGQSILPLLSDPNAPWDRDIVFSETFFPNGPDAWTSRSRVVRSHTHKLIVTEEDGSEPVESLYLNDGGAYDEGEDLFETGRTDADEAELQTLRSAYEALDADLTPGW